MAEHFFFTSVSWINLIRWFHAHLQNSGYGVTRQGEGGKLERGDTHLKWRVPQIPSFAPMLVYRGNLFSEDRCFKVDSSTNTQAYFKSKHTRYLADFLGTLTKASFWLGRIWKANKAPIHLSHSSNQLCLKTANYFRVNRVKPTYWSQTVHRKWKKI